MPAGVVIIIFIASIIILAATYAVYTVKSFRIDEKMQNIKNHTNNILKHEYELRNTLAYYEDDEYKDMVDEKITKIHNHALAIKKTLKDNR